MLVAVSIVSLVRWSTTLIRKLSPLSEIGQCRDEQRRNGTTHLGTRDEWTGERPASKDGSAVEPIGRYVRVHDLQVGDGSNGGECATCQREKNECREVAERGHLRDHRTPTRQFRAGEEVGTDVATGRGRRASSLCPSLFQCASPRHCDCCP